MVSWSPHIEITAIDGQTLSKKLTNMEIQDRKSKSSTKPCNINLLLQKPHPQITETIKLIIT